MNKKATWSRIPGFNRSYSISSDGEQIRRNRYSVKRADGSVMNLPTKHLSTTTVNGRRYALLENNSGFAQKFNLQSLLRRATSHGTKTQKVTRAKAKKIDEKQLPLPLELKVKPGPIVMEREGFGDGISNRVNAALERVNSLFGNRLNTASNVVVIVA